MQDKFIQINVLTPNQKIPDKVQVTPTIFTVPDYNMYAADDAFKWLQQEIIKEQRTQNTPQQRQAQQIKNQTQQFVNGGIRMNAPSFSGNGGTPNTRSGPAGQKPSESFNTYDPNRDGGVMPFMTDMGANRSGNFSYLNVDSAPPFNYAHVQKDEQDQGNNMQFNPSMMQQRGRPKKLEDSKYEAFLLKDKQIHIFNNLCLHHINIYIYILFIFYLLLFIVIYCYLYKFKDILINVIIKILI